MQISIKKHLFGIHFCYTFAITPLTTNYSLTKTQFGMKKLILMAVMALATVSSFAQQAVGTFTIQPKIGLNLANLTNGDADIRAGVAAGVEFEYQVSDIFSLSAGALYSMQGCKNTIEGVDVTTKLDYINVPILANVYVVKGLAVKLGLQPGFNVSHKLSVAKGSTSGSTDIPGVKSVDLSIPVGLSYEYSNFVFDARYNFGVTKVADDADSKNSVFQFTLGYKFAL